MYCSSSWALFLPFSSSWNNKLGFKSLMVRWVYKEITEQFNMSQWGSFFLDIKRYLLAQPVVIGAESSPAVTFIKHHQPPVNTMEQLQFFPFCIFCFIQDTFLTPKGPLFHCS